MIERQKMIAKNQRLAECQQQTNAATTTNIDSSHFSEKRLHSKKHRPTKTIPRITIIEAEAMEKQQNRQKQQQHHSHQQQQQQRRRLQRFRQQQQRKRCSEIFKNFKIHKNRKDILTFLKANYKYKRRSRSSIHALPLRHRKWCTKHCAEHALLQTKSDNEKMYFSLINLISAVVVIGANLIDRRWFAASASEQRDDGADSAATMLDVDGVNNDDVNDDSDETSCQRNYDKLSTLVGQTHQRQQQQRLHQKQQQPPHQYQKRHQHQRQQHQRQQQQHALRQPKVWLRRLSSGMSQQPIYGPRRRRQRRRTSSTIGASRLSSQPSDRRTQVMPIFMTLFIALALSGRCAVEGGACWQKSLSNGKCNEIFSLNITKSDCCTSNQGFSYTDRDLSSVEYFFATTIGGGMECAPCLESCKNIRCGLNKKCAKRKGRPKCICSPECGAAARTQLRAKVFRGTQYQQQHPAHPNHHQTQQQLQLHQQPHHSTSSQLQHHSRQRHLETAVIFGKSARDIRSLSSETQSQNVELEDAVVARRMSTAAAVGASDRHSSSQRKMIAVVQSQARAQSKREPKEHQKLIIVEPQRTDEAGGAKTTTRRLQVISNVNNNNHHHHHRNSNSNNNSKKRKKSEKERVHKQDQSIKIRTLQKNKKSTTKAEMTTTEEKEREEANEKKRKKKKKKRKEETVMMELDAIREEMGKTRRGSTTTSQPSSRRKPNTNNNNSNNNNNNNNNGNNNKNNDEDLQEITNFDANNTKLRHIHSNARQRFQDAPNRDQEQHREQQEKPHQKQQQRQQHAGRHHPLRKHKKKQHNEAKDQNTDTTTTLTVMSGSEIATAAAATTTSRRRQQSPTTTTKMSFTPSAHSSASEDQPRLLNHGSSFAASSLAISSASSGSTAAAALATSSAATAKASSSSSSSSSVTTIALLKETEASSTSSSSSSSSSLSAARSSVSWPPSLSSSATAVTIADINGNRRNTGKSSSNNRSLINSSDDLTFDDRIYEKFNLHGFPSQQYKFTQLESIHHSSHHHHHHHPVCGTDGRTYNTECQLKKRACRTDNSDLIVAYHGHCKTTCNGVKCLNGLTCVEDHYTIPHCIACRIDCPLDDVDVASDGHEVNNNADDDALEIDASRAVCGVDGKTYRSVCDINRMICKIGRSIGVAYPGPCRDDRVSCNDISCGPKRTCLVDLLTHEPRCVSCRYKCARKRRPVSLRFEEGKICGVNKRTYNSWCEMRKDSCATGYFIDIKSLGECQK